MTNQSGSASYHPTVSVAIPSYNGERYLAETITSALAQTVPLTEIRVLDNASTDGSAEVARTLLGEGSVIVHPTNVGAAENFRLGLHGSAPTDFFLWLAVGDRLAPEFVAECLAALHALPTSPACLTGIRFIDENGVQIGVQADPALASRNPRVRLRSFLRRSRWTEFYCLYRRDALLSSPNVVPDYGSDVILTWWFLLRSPLAVLDEVLLDYRIEGEKTVTDVDKSLNPEAVRSYWHMRRLWQKLWTMATDSGVDPRISRTARKELLLALGHRNWIVHLGSDVANRWPLLRTPGLAVKKRLLS